MNIPYIRAPHSEGAPSAAVASAAPNAALLIDFDNVTMGMRSDLSKELKNLLRSDIIKGKVTVQRAYADWRRYPQYIVPLSEASIDLIFAPAYGSSKKNATDIRMAIDGMELVFTRPEIGTYILLTGDSDFSSLVLKLKEYGKYVIGVGIQESSSDILVQNCDEYYSYTALTGLRKSGSGGDRSGLDPWVLAEKAVEQMKRRNDVMRSDRLKQVMLELDSSFDEKSLGFSKFSRFLTEAAQKGLLRLKKLENGQYEISEPSGRGAGNGSAASEPAPSRSPERRGRGREDRPARSSGRGDERSERSRSRSESPGETPPAADPSQLTPAYELLVEAVTDLLEDQEGDAVRDSDVKRRMLAIQGSWDEAELGYPKFSKFLKQAHDHEVIDLRKGSAGNYEVAIGKVAPGAAAGAAAPPKPEPPRERKASGAADTPRPEVPTHAPSRDEGITQETPVAGRLRPRTSSRRRGGKDEPPPLFEGQTIVATSSGASTVSAGASAPSGPGEQGPASSGPMPSPPEPGAGPVVRHEATKESGAPAGGVVDVQALRLPTERDSVIKYLANSYKGVGAKTAEVLVDELGDDLFPTLNRDPGKIRALLTPSRAEKVLDEWNADFERRTARLGTDGNGGAPPEAGGKDGGDAGGRRRGRRTRSRSSR